MAFMGGSAYLAGHSLSDQPYAELAARALDRDTCITGSSADYFDGYDAGATGSHPSSTTDFVWLTSSTSFGDLSLLPVRGHSTGPHVLMA